MRAAAILVLLALAAPAEAAAAGCATAPVLWGDGRHDDAAALNAWFRGQDVRWAATGEPVGPLIEGHSFVLSAPLYVPSGTNRRLEGFRMVWPRTRERLSGGTIAAGRDPDAPPLVRGITKVGGDPGEGVPYDAPPPAPRPPPQAGCLIS